MNDIEEMDLLRSKIIRDYKKLKILNKATLKVQNRIGENRNKYKVLDYKMAEEDGRLKIVTSEEKAPKRSLGTVFESMSTTERRRFMEMVK